VSGNSSLRRHQKVPTLKDITNLEQASKLGQHRKIRDKVFLSALKTLEREPHEKIETISLGIERIIETGSNINVPETRIHSAPLVPRYISLAFSVPRGNT